MRSTISPRRATPAVSFETPEYTANADAIGTLRLLEAIRILGLEDRFYPGVTSGCLAMCARRRNETRRSTRAPLYACAKMYSYWITVNYRGRTASTPATASFQPRVAGARRNLVTAKSPRAGRESVWVCRIASILAI